LAREKKKCSALKHALFGIKKGSVDRKYEVQHTFKSNLKESPYSLQTLKLIVP
jgi:hypothetical protein